MVLRDERDSLRRLDRLMMRNQKHDCGDRGRSSRSEHQGGSSISDDSLLPFILGEALPPALIGKRLMQPFSQPGGHVRRRAG